MAPTIEDIKRIVSLQLGVKNVQDGDHFLESLNAESMDVLNIIVAVEEKYHVEIPESQVPELLTPLDLYNYLQSRI